MDTDSGPNMGTQSEDHPDDHPSPTTTQAQDPQVGILSAENRKRRRENDALRAELDQLKASHASAADQAIAKARAEGETAYKARWREAKVENLALARLAAKGVTATELAMKALDLSHVDVDDDGRAEGAAVDAVIDETLKRFPMLAPAPSPEGSDNGKALATGQRRVTQEELLKADKDKRNELLRFALGR